MDKLIKFLTNWWESETWTCTLTGSDRCSLCVNQPLIQTLFVPGDLCMCSSSLQWSGKPLHISLFFPVLCRRAHLGHTPHRGSLGRHSVDPQFPGVASQNTSMVSSCWISLGKQRPVYSWSVAVGSINVYLSEFVCLINPCFLFASLPSIPSFSLRPHLLSSHFLASSSAGGPLLPDTSSTWWARLPSSLLVALSVLPQPHPLRLGNF